MNPIPVLANKRHYYDQIFYGDDINWIAEVHFADADYYEKGMEYLSSLYILCCCGGLIAGNCGGSGFVLCGNNSLKYDYIFNKGTYGIDDKMPI